jgi:predicted nucleic acid-binding protein
LKDAEGRILIDTNVLFYATLEDDPLFERPRDLLFFPRRGERYVSVQNLAEMFPNLTCPRMEQPDEPAVARVKIQSIASLPTLQVFRLMGDVQAIALELCEKYGITRQRDCDAQLAATMVVHEIQTLLTENDRDFNGMTEIRAVNPFQPGPSSSQERCLLQSELPPSLLWPQAASEYIMRELIPLLP